MKKPVMLMLLFSMIALYAAAQNTWTKHAAKKWFKQKEWSSGIPYKLNEPIDIQEFARQYHLNKAAWDKAFNFIKTQDLQAIKPGKYPIDGEEVFASVTANATKEYDKTTWESHRKYIDLQFVIDGGEKIGVCRIDKATVTKPYDEAKDLINYTARGKVYTGGNGSYFLFFPNDAHRPNITTGGNNVEKKLVIKIRVVAPPPPASPD